MTDFKIKQGSTFARVLRWESPTVTYKPITAIAKSAPVSITATAHGVPPGWRVTVQSAQGMRQINAANSPPRTKDYHQATVVNANTVELNDVNALEFSTYTSGGVLAYNTPVDLTGYTARMQLRADAASATILSTLTTENGGIVISPSGYTISLLMSATATAALSPDCAVYSLEMVSSTGVVTEILSGAISIDAEVTR